VKSCQLTARKVSTAKKPGYYGDGGGLYLQVTPSAHSGAISRSWVFRFTSPATGKIRDMGMGPLDTFELKEARSRARECRKQVADGLDPIEERRRKRMALRLAHASRKTFRECAADYLAEHAESWKNAKHRAQWETSLDRASAAFGDLNVREIDVDALVKFLGPVWRATPETGSRIRGRVEAVLDWATARKFRHAENPARWRGHLEHLLKAKPRAKHHRALPFVELPGFMARLRDAESISARALEFTILTAARTSEVIGAKWDEIDLKTAVWKVPAERMKSSRAHRVPLIKRAIAILEDTPRERGGYVFPGARAKAPLSNMAMLELLRGMRGDGITVHGFRSTFSDWARERTAYPRDVVEMALAHIIKDKSEAAYRRGDALEKRRRLMDEWAKYCSSPAQLSGDVVALRHG
jgi:integrase